MCLGTKAFSTDAMPPFLHREQLSGAGIVSSLPPVCVKSPVVARHRSVVVEDRHGLRNVRAVDRQFGVKLAENASLDIGEISQWGFSRYVFAASMKSYGLRKTQERTFEKAVKALNETRPHTTS